MNSTPETRYSLIGKLKNSQDVQAWEEFVDIYQPIILRLCRAKGLQHADAYDVTQEVLARIASVVDQFDPSRKDATFRGWLYRITQNSVVDFFRQRKTDLLEYAEPHLSNVANAMPDPEDSAAFLQEFEKQMFIVVAKEIRGHVQNSTWLAFRKTEIEQRPVSEVALELGMSSGAVYVARSRVIARFKREVATRLKDTCGIFNEDDRGTNDA